MYNDFMDQTVNSILGIPGIPGNDILDSRFPGINVQGREWTP